MVPQDLDNDGSDMDDHRTTCNEFDQKYRKHFVRFHGWLLVTLNSMYKKKLNMQMYWHTANAAFHGLSRTGIQAQAAMGFMMKLSSFDEMRRQELAAAEERIRCSASATWNENVHFCFVFH
jgi:hypothetical protein